MSRIKIRFIENKSFIKIVMCTLPNINIIIMSTGTVKFFNNSKGFGFIKDGASEKEYFVHVSGLNDEIKENDEVTFDLQEGKKGLNAVNVKLV
jgi:CspA family cold shock protein